MKAKSKVESKASWEVFEYENSIPDCQLLRSAIGLWQCLSANNLSQVVLPFLRPIEIMLIVRRLPLEVYLAPWLLIVQALSTCSTPSKARFSRLQI